MRRGSSGPQDDPNLLEEADPSNGSMLYQSTHLERTPPDSQSNALTLCLPQGCPSPPELGKHLAWDRVEKDETEVDELVGK